MPLLTPEQIRAHFDGKQFTNELVTDIFYEIYGTRDPFTIFGPHNASEMREWLRLLTGEYQLIRLHSSADTNERYLRVLFSADPSAVPHIAVNEDKKGQVEYSKDWRDLREDTQSATRPSRLPGWSSMPDNMTKLFTEFITAQSEGWECKLTQDADEIEWAYENGPRSCMRSDVTKFRGVHPTRAYATPDCGLVYVTNGEKVLGRTVVSLRENNRGYVRYFCDTNAAQVMINEFLAEHGLEAHISLKGNLIDALWDEEHNDYVGPYIDGDQLSFEKTEIDGHEYLRCVDLCDGVGNSYGSHATGGLLSIEGREHDSDNVECAHCGNNYHPDDTVVQLDGRTICDGCHEEDGFEVTDLHGRDGRVCVDSTPETIHYDALNDRRYMGGDPSDHRLRRIEYGTYVGDLVHEDDCTYCIDIDDWVEDDDAVATDDYRNVYDEDALTETLDGFNVYDPDECVETTTTHDGDTGLVFNEENTTITTDGVRVYTPHLETLCVQCLATQDWYFDADNIPQPEQEAA